MIPLLLYCPRHFVCGEMKSGVHVCILLPVRVLASWSFQSLAVVMLVALFCRHSARHVKATSTADRVLGGAVAGSATSEPSRPAVQAVSLARMISSVGVQAPQSSAVAVGSALTAPPQAVRGNGAVMTGGGGPSQPSSQPDAPLGTMSAMVSALRRGVQFARCASSESLASRSSDRRASSPYPSSGDHPRSSSRDDAPSGSSQGGGQSASTAAGNDTREVPWRQHADRVRSASFDELLARRDVGVAYCNDRSEVRNDHLRKLEARHLRKLKGTGSALIVLGASPPPYNDIASATAAAAAADLSLQENASDASRSIRGARASSSSTQRQVRGSAPASADESEGCAGSVGPWAESVGATPVAAAASTDKTVRGVLFITQAGQLVWDRAGFLFASVIAVPTNTEMLMRPSPITASHTNSLKARSDAQKLAMRDAIKAVSQAKGCPDDKKRAVYERLYSV